MSNRYSTQNRNESLKGGSRSKKQFVPKRVSNATQTLSNSLRDSFRTQSDGAGASMAGVSDGAARESMSIVGMGDNGDRRVTSGIQRGSFVNYLPQDEAMASGLGADEGALDPMESQCVVDILNRELSRLLKLSPRDFWIEVSRDQSLHAFLESFLKFRSRWFDFPYHGAKGIVAGVVVGEFELCRRVFMVLYRISSNGDPGARVADTLSQKEHAALLQETKLLDLPKLLDICAIYGHENEELTKKLVVNAMKAQPAMHDELAAVISHFLRIIQTMYQRSSSSLEDLFSSGHRKDHGLSRLYLDYLEVMDFINDAVVSMDAFVNAYKNAAVPFSCPVEMSHGNEELLITLARLHDSLIPSFNRGFHILLDAGEDGHRETSSGMLSDVSTSLKMLSMRIVQFGWRLLYLCYLSDEAFDENDAPAVAMKMFPANVEEPVIRADILTQSLRDLAGDLIIVEGNLTGTFLQNIEKNYNVLTIIEQLRNTGWMSMDDEQFEFLSRLLHPLEANVKETSQLQSPAADVMLQVDEDTAIIESKITQIKDLFPDYGTGFLAACLEVYNQNPEEVIQRILEGTLHEDLQRLDISADNISPLKPVPYVSTNDKGKGKLEESSVSTNDKGKGKLEESSVSTNDKGKGKLVESVPAPLINRMPPAVPTPSSASSSGGRYIRKTTNDSPDYETLDAKDKKDLAKTTALISQLEYEDEYDDSFDDLGISVGDSGLEETEIPENQLNFNREKLRDADSGSSTQDGSNSKWNSRKKPQFYVKDGRNYSYRVEGSVAVANYNEASLVNQAQRELIHGLGRGGNIPLGAVKRLEANMEQDNENRIEGGMQYGPENSRGRGRRGKNHNKKDHTEANEEQDNESQIDGGVRDGPGDSRGRGGRRGGRNHHRRDRAMRKHLSGLTGY